ncbi:LysR family transcriptional regulator [Sinisalibacter aestuarii]|uniref:LysR family transcriptional regulator n=2 Tax=Sinisalibacter aestuarii TaxID=2949426 RepID=A0ABQ5LS99_9RHOB|nr:LysR family transcriptional regulator [Sinisalibacter aestuarii]
MNWDDIRFILAVAQEGSLSGAARALGVNHATVLRRISGFEAALGVTIFDRTARGYRVAPRRGRVIAAMEAMQAGALGVERALMAARAPLSGVVRVTSTDTICQAVLPPIVARLMAEAEGLTIELNSQNLHADLARLDADIAVRPAQRLPDNLTATQAGQMAFAVYAAPGGQPGWLGFAGSLERSLPASWLAQAMPDAEIAGRADSFVVLREMAAAGQGRAVLPCVLGDVDARLLRLDGIMPPMRVDLWVATHHDLADVPRIEAVRRMLAEALRREAPRLLGEP